MKKIIKILFILLSINIYCQLPNNISERDKIYGLSKVWSEVKRNFVYYDRINFNWDSLFIANIDKVKNIRDDYQYYKLLQEMVAKLKDGHTSVWLPSIYYDSILGKPPIETRLIENKVIITRVFNKSLLKNGLKRGMEIVKINNLDTKTYVYKYIAPYESASSPQGFIDGIYGRSLFFGFKNEVINIKIKKVSGQTESFVLDRKNLPYDIKFNNPTFEYRKTDNNIGILTINEFWGENFKEEFDAIFLKIVSARKLIIDLRNNEGGSSQKAYYVLKHFANNFFYGSAWRTRQYKPAFISWGNLEEWYEQPAEKISKAKGKRYKNDIIVLTSSRTFSAAEDFLIAFKQMNRGNIIGVPTGGSTGNPIEFDLPNGGGMKICSKEDTFKNGDKFVGIGIIPDIEIKETFDDFIKNNDLIMKSAIKILNE